MHHKPRHLTSSSRPRTEIYVPCLNEVGNPRFISRDVLECAFDPFRNIILAVSAEDQQREKSYSTETRFSCFEL